MGSIPTAPAISVSTHYYGGRGEVVNASDCGSDTRGFDSPRPPHSMHLFIMAIVAKWLTHRIVVPTFGGSIPLSRPIYFWGIAKR